MLALSGEDLSKALRSACDSVKNRLWIASPYVGSWQSVRSVLGRRWWDNGAINVRLLTDEEGKPNGHTLRRFAQKGSIHHIRGLHAKIYVIDNQVLLASANLTGAAFARRYEAGVLLTGKPAESAIKLFESWWDKLSRPFDSSLLSELLRVRRNDAGEDVSEPLRILHSLPDDPGDYGGHRLANTFLDYPQFLEFYKILAQEYVALPRIWPKVPLYFEIDGFLDFLFHWHPSLPSKPYQKLPPRKLSSEDRRRELNVLRGGFKRWADSSNDNGHWRLSHSKLVRQRLNRSSISRLNTGGIRDIADGLQCLKDARVRDRFLNNNTPATIRIAWRDLLHGRGLLTEKMSICASRLFGFKRSCVQELLGFFEPHKYPLRNANVNAGLRYLGFDVSSH